MIHMIHMIHTHKIIGHIFEKIWGNTQMHLLHMIHMVHDTYDAYDRYAESILFVEKNEGQQSNTIWY